MAGRGYIGGRYIQLSGYGKYIVLAQSSSAGG